MLQATLISVASGRRLQVDIVEGRVIGQPTASLVLSSRNKIGRLTCHVFRAPYIRFRQQVEHQPIWKEYAVLVGNRRLEICDKAGCTCVYD